MNSSGNDIAAPLDAHYYLGCGNRGGVEREFVAYTLKIRVGATVIVMARKQVKARSYRRIYRALSA